MNAKITHIQINVSNFEISKKFYLELFKVLDWKILSEKEVLVGWTNGESSFWMVKTEEKFKGNKFHRKNTGLNHIAFKVSSKQEVDEFSNKFLSDKKQIVLYDSPKEYPEYTKDYYAVFFEDPDRIKLEVMHHS